MAFQIKDFASIAASAINWMKATTKKVTDFNVGSVARTLVEAPSAEIEQLYLQAFIGLKEAIPVSVYNSFNFQKLPAASAAGIVRVTLTASDNDRVIPAGTRFDNLGKRGSYISQQDVSIAAGSSYCDVGVVYQDPGSEGNLPALQGFDLSPMPIGFVAASNPAAFISGVDEESDEDRRLRFNAFILSLARGTVPALEYGAKLTKLYDPGGNVAERVAVATVVEPYLADPTQPNALVQVFIHNGTGATSGQLVDQCQRIIDGYVDEAGNKIPGWKAAGVIVNVIPASEQLVDVIGTITALPGYQVTNLAPLAMAACGDYIRGLKIGEKAIRSEIVALVMGIEGVYNFIPSSPPADTIPGANVKLLPGSLIIVPSV